MSRRQGQRLNQIRMSGFRYLRDFIPQLSSYLSQRDNVFPRSRLKTKLNISGFRYLLDFIPGAISEMFFPRSIRT